MILIGQYDSSFVRRIGIALTLYGLPFEHRPWSVFSDAEKVRAHNPLMRVPTLVLDDGSVLCDSMSMIDYIDSLVPAGKALLPRSEPARHRAMRIIVLAAGLAEKCVALFYELRFHEQIATSWVERCRSQMLGAVAALEADRASRPGDYWFGDRIGHADIAVAASLRHVTDSHPDLLWLKEFPALEAHCARLEALPVFRQIQQAFIAPR